MNRHPKQFADPRRSNHRLHKGNSTKIDENQLKHQKPVFGTSDYLRVVRYPPNSQDFLYSRVASIPSVSARSDKFLFPKVQDPINFCFGLGDFHLKLKLPKIRFGDWSFKLVGSPSTSQHYHNSRVQSGNRLRAFQRAPISLTRFVDQEKRVAVFFYWF